MFKTGLEPLLEKIAIEHSEWLKNQAADVAATNASHAAWKAKQSKSESESKKLLPNAPPRSVSSSPATTRLRGGRALTLGSRM